MSRFQLRIALFVSILKFYRNAFLNSSYYIVLSVLTIYFKHLNNEIVNNVSGFFILNKIECESIDYPSLFKCALKIGNHVFMRKYAVEELNYILSESHICSEFYFMFII